jgi:hypothetical protein
VVSEIDIVPKVVNPVSFGQLVWQREINPWPSSRKQILEIDNI